MTSFKNRTQLETFIYFFKKIIINLPNKQKAHVIVFDLKGINAALQPKSTLFPLLFHHEWENFSEQ